MHSTLTSLWVVLLQRQNAAATVSVANTRFSKITLSESYFQVPKLIQLQLSKHRKNMLAISLTESPRLWTKITYFSAPASRIGIPSFNAKHGLTHRHETKTPQCGVKAPVNCIRTRITSAGAFLTTRQSHLSGIFDTAHAGNLLT